MKKVIVFDLDDTLYEEIKYVYSGFKKVSFFLADKFSENSEEIYQLMKRVLEKNGRGKVFDIVISKYYQFDNFKLVQECIQVYRNHIPNIRLSEDVQKVLTSLSKEYPLYIVTDGNVTVQLNKAKALGLEKYMEKIIATYSHGEDKGKPSTYWFEKIIDEEGISPNQMVYIGDNANKDFIGIKAIGCQTVRINQGMFKGIVPSKEYEAAYVIDTLNEFPSVINNL